MQLDIFAALDSSSGRTSPAPSAATRGATLLKWWERWRGAESMSRQRDGETKAWRWARTDFLNGACLTRNGSEWRSGGVACSLSSMLETGPVERRFFLSPKACAGILRRAEKRGKDLPEALRRALAAVADSAPTSTSTED